MKVKRFFTIILILTLFSFTLWASGGKEGAKETGKPYKGVKIVWGDLARIYTDSVKEFLPGFEEETGIQVEIEQMASKGLIDKILIECQGRTGYFDVIYLSPGYMGALIKGKCLLELDEYMEKYDVDFTRDYPGSAIEICRYPGVDANLAFPFVCNPTMIVYRTDLFEDNTEKANFRKKYGYELKPPMTMQQVLDMAQFFTRDTDGDGDIDLYGWGKPHGSQSAAAMTLMWAIWGFGGEIYNRDTFDVTINSPEALKALKFLKELFKYEPVETNSWLSWEQANFFKEGKMAMAPIWVQYVFRLLDPEWSDMADKTWCSILPGKHWIGGGGLSITKDSTNPEAAFLYLKWLTSREMSIPWFKAGGPVTRVSAYESTAIKEQYPRLADVFPIELEAIKNHSRNRIIIPEAQSIQEELFYLWFDFIEEKMTAEEVLARAEKKIKGLFEKAGY